MRHQFFCQNSIEVRMAVDKGGDSNLEFRVPKFEIQVFMKLKFTSLTPESPTSAFGILNSNLLILPSSFISQCLNGISARSLPRFHGNGYYGDQDDQ